jgi:hypothetical protein
MRSAAQRSRWSRAFGLAVAALALGACSSLNVQTDWNTTLDFTKYKTWDFKNDTLPYATFTQERIRSNIANTLMSKGLTRSETNPDLIVVSRVNLSSTTQYTTVSTGYGYGPAWGGYGYGGVGMSQTTAQQIPRVRSRSRSSIRSSTSSSGAARRIHS